METNRDMSQAARLWGSSEGAEARKRSEAQRAREQGPATELMLDLAQVQAGNRVLDVAAGTGDQTIMAARRVGPTGSVLAIDLSASMLEVTADAARRAGLSNVEARVMDAQSLDLEAESFDAIISRNGLQWVPDLRKALAGFRRVLKPGGRLAAIVFSAGERNPFITIPRIVVQRRGNLPAPQIGAPGQFALGEPGLLTEAFREAGFNEAELKEIPTRQQFPSIAEALSAIQAATVPGSPSYEWLSKASDEDRESTWAEIGQALRQFEAPTGVEAVGELLLAVGTK